MNLNPRYWFQKRQASTANAWAEAQNRMRYNALFRLDPDVLVRALGMFAAGDIAPMERILDDFERRDDKMKVGAFKMSAAVASKPWEIRIARGEEENAQAKHHQEVLTRFWNRITVTDAFCQNRRGGIRTLIKQMMSAQSRVYAIHDVTWHVRPDGELEATFTQVPAWSFENRTGRLRYLKDPAAYTGVEMKDGEWLVTCGEGVGITAAILAMAKRLSWNDWLLFSEKCGMPIVVGNTTAKEDTPAWKALVSAIKAIAPKTGLLADVESKIQAVPFGGAAGTVTYQALVDTVDRAISSLYRGGDLATMSHGGDGVGVNAQDGESELMDADGCAMITETLNRQIERLVIRFTCGDFEPLAGIIINPPAETEDIDRDIKIDMHLAGLGVKLSKADALARYGRTEATNESDELKLPEPAPQMGFQGGFNALPNENAEPAPEDREPAPENAEPAPVLRAFAQDLSPAADEVKKLLADLDAGKDVRAAAASLADRLPSLLPDDPALAAIIAEEMAKEFASQPFQETRTSLENEGHPYTKCPGCGKFMSSSGNCEHCGFVEDNDRLIARGKKALSLATSGKQKSVKNAIYKKGLGPIDFELGWKGKGYGMDGGSGVLKLQQKHPQDLQSLPENIVKGKVVKAELTIYDANTKKKVGTGKVDNNRMYIINNPYFTTLRKRLDGTGWIVTSHYKSDEACNKYESRARELTRQSK